MKILILASNPHKDLNLDDEIRLLRSMIDRSRDRDRFEIVSEPGVRVGDLQELLLRHKPQIVHFCGHGGGEEGLIFKMDEGGEQWVRADALANMFGLNPICSHVKCVLLNAYYSEKQADAIVSRIHYVIGMSHAIQDNAAIAFSKGFYLALGEGCSINDAFEFGRNAIQLEISGSSKMRSAAIEEGARKAEVVNAIQQTEIPEHLKPILKCNSTLIQTLDWVVSSSEQPLSQAKREEIQLDVAKALTEKGSSQKQYRNRIREFLVNRKLTKVEEIRLDQVRRILGLSVEDSSQKQYRSRIREFLVDRKLTKVEEIRLDQVRRILGLSVEEANRILEEEQKPLQQARDNYQEMLIRLIEEEHYPFSPEMEADLQGLRQELQLPNEEVEAIIKPILEAVQKDRKELKQREP